MGHFTGFLYIILLVVMACAKVTLQGKACRGHVNDLTDSLVYNAVMFASIALFAALLFPKNAVDGGTVGMAVIDAVTAMLFQTLYAVALRIGPVSLTVLIINFNVLFTTAVSAVLFREPMYITQGFGVVMLIVSMVLGVDRKGDHKEMTPKWFALTVLASVSGAACSIIQKWFMKMPSGSLPGADTMFLILYNVFAAVFAVGLYLILTRCMKKEKSACVRTASVYGYAALIGLLLAVYQKLMMQGLQKIDGTFFFPTFAGLQSLGMCVIGVVLFRDRLNKKQLVGVACGIVSLALMNIRLGFHL